MRSVRFSDISFITLSAMSWVLRDKVELKRGKRYACVAVVMCINSENFRSPLDWLDVGPIRRRKERLGFCSDVFGSLLATFRDSVSVLSSENSPSVLRVTPEDGTDTLCRNVANILLPYAAQHPRREDLSCTVVAAWYSRREKCTCRESSAWRSSRNQSPCWVSYNWL